MDNKTFERYMWLEKQLETDPEYLALMQRLKENMPALEDALNSLSPEHRDAVIEYIGICGELAERTGEIACFGP